MSLAALMTVAGLGVTGLAPAFAQTTAQSESVTVTGSRISRLELTGSTPVVSIGLDTLSDLGIENFADMATQLPQFAPSFGSSRTQSTFSGIAASGLNLANLRNLGSGRSLVLINGRRAAGGTSTGTAVDFNNIPTANIERIEIITGGASAIYGSDAVAGVINIITKKNFDGVEVGFGYGQATEGDNKNPTAHFMAGGKFGSSGRASFTLQVDRQGRVSCADRYICADDFLWLSPASPLYGPNARSGVGEGGRFFVGANSYVRRGDTFGNTLTTFSTPIDGYNRNAQRDIAIPTKRVMAAAEIEQKLSSRVRAYGEFNYGETNIDSSFEGHPFQSNQPGNRFGTLNPNIPLSNPFIPAVLRDAVTSYNATAPANAQLTEIVWWQRFSDAIVGDGGNRGADSSRKMMRAVAGVKGEFDSLGGWGRDWRWDLSHVVGRTSVNLNTEGLISTSNLYHGLRVEADPSNPGQFRCIDAGARAQGCVPINPFAPYTPAMRKSLQIGSMAYGMSSLNDTVATLAGTWADLPAGSLRGVVGAEYRTFSGYLDRDVVVNNALATGNQISDTDFAKTSTKEVFAEVLVPVLADLPMVNAFNLEGAIRRSSTEKASYNTWNFGGDWEPMDGLRFRAKQARSVRAPSPGELSGIGQTFGVVQDPCTASRRNANPTRAANCLAAGVPANYAPPQTVEQGVGGLSGGNANLAPENGTTMTLGAVWTPKAAKGFSLAVDRFSIKVDDIITVVSRQIAVNKCYDAGILCSAVTRGSNVQIPGANYVLTAVDEQLQNVAQLTVKGIDIDLKYAFKLPKAMGDLNLGFLATRYDEATLIPLAGSAPVDLLGQAGGSTTDQGWVKFTASANVGWQLNRWKANWNVRHIGRADMAVGTTAAGYPQIGAHSYHNIRVAYDLNKGSEVFAGVTNVFDKKPPFFASGTSGTQALDTIPGYYDVFGRSWFVGARMKF